MCLMLMIDRVLSVSVVSASAQSLGEGGRLQHRDQPLEAEAPRVHPPPAGAHRLPQSELRGIDGDDERHLLFRQFFKINS